MVAGESTNGQLTLADGARAISALRQLGLTPESHRLAVEAAVAAGL